jgi:hypothetical protein
MAHAPPVRPGEKFDDRPVEVDGQRFTTGPSQGWCEDAFASNGDHRPAPSSPLTIVFCKRELSKRSAGHPASPPLDVLYGKRFTKKMHLDHFGLHNLGHLVAHELTHAHGWDDWDHIFRMHPPLSY